MNETLLELLRHSFFQDISKRLPDFEKKFHKRIYKQDQMLIKEGEFSEGIGIIDSGLANAFLKYHDGKSEWFCDLKKSDFFGEISMLNKQPSFLTIVCCQRIVCYFLPADEYRFIADAFFPEVKTFFYQSALEKVSRIVDKMNRQISVAAKPVGNERYYSPYIQKAIQYINKHYDSPISLDILSLEIGVSKYHLSRHFKADTGLSFTQYLNHRRIIEAKRILLNQDVNVSQACYAVGFNELSHFSRVFKHFEKTSPSEFRRMMTAARSLEKESVRSCCY